MIKEGDLLKFEGLSRFEELEHFTTTKHGGVSRGRYESLNGSPYCGDCLADVLENQRRICAHLTDPEVCIVLPYQVHGEKIVHVDETLLALSEERRQEALHGVDALIARCRGVMIAVSTADCVPVLLYDPIRKGVGVVHAGWRGTVDRITQKTVLRMVDEWGSDPTTIFGAIAPSISVEAFEVGDEVYQTFEDNGFPMDRIAQRNSTTQKWHIDLWEANVWQLEAIGIERKHVETSDLCTYSQHQSFFSARRLTIRSGRNLTGIGLFY